MLYLRINIIIEQSLTEIIKSFQMIDFSDLMYLEYCICIIASLF